jgi:hypothetical protein
MHMFVCFVFLPVKGNGKKNPSPLLKGECVVEAHELGTSQAVVLVALSPVFCKYMSVFIA